MDRPVAPLIFRFDADAPPERDIFRKRDEGQSQVSIQYPNRPRYPPTYQEEARGEEATDEGLARNREDLNRHIRREGLLRRDNMALALLDYQRDIIGEATLQQRIPYNIIDDRLLRAEFDAEDSASRRYAEQDFYIQTGGRGFV